MCEPNFIAMGYKKVDNVRFCLLFTQENKYTIRPLLFRGNFVC